MILFPVTSNYRNTHTIPYPGIARSHLSKIKLPTAPSLGGFCFPHYSAHVQTSSGAPTVPYNAGRVLNL